MTRIKTAITTEIEIVTIFPLIAIFLLAADAAWARPAPVPLPRPRPLEAGPSARDIAQPPAATEQAAEPPAEEPQEPSECQIRLAESGFALFEPLPALTGARDCGARDVLRLEAIQLRDKGRVAITPPAVMRCTMAEAMTHWVRDELAPAFSKSGPPIREIDNYASYDCRGRNNIKTARTSEHGFANAIDIRGVKLANGKFIDWTDRKAPRDMRENIRRIACESFTTVLGPGSDGYHESHIHLDLAQRRNDFRLCKWDVLDPAPEVPLPRPRPPEAGPAAHELEE